MCTTRTVRVVAELDLEGPDMTMWRVAGIDADESVAMWYESDVGPFDQQEVAVEVLTAILRSLGALWIGGLVALAVG